MSRRGCLLQVGGGAVKIIVLDHPRVRSEKKFNEIANSPLCSCLMGGYAAAALKEGGMDVLYIDDTITGSTFQESTQNIVTRQVDLLCVNAVYFWEHTRRLFDFLENLKHSISYVI